MTDDIDRPDDDACPAHDIRSPKPPSGVSGDGAEPDDAEEPSSNVHTPVRPHPLHQFSLKGRAEEYEARAQDTKPLLGPHVMSGQATMFYAPPNTGKTLITLHLALEAVHKGLIIPSDLYYVNSDDSSKGIAEKLRILQDVGAHVLVPGQNGFRSSDLQNLLFETAERNASRGTCVIIDTLKKCIPLNDKKLTSAFAEACRQYVVGGGTILALGHTTKSPNADGSPRYTGTTDILEDFDAVYIVETATSPKADDEEKAVKFAKLKSRASSPDVVAYAYASGSDLSYTVRLASVRAVDPEDMKDFRTFKEIEDYRIVLAIQELIDEGFEGGQMALGKAAAEKCGVTGRKAQRILERHIDETPYWTFRTGAHGVRRFERLDP